MKPLQDCERTGVRFTPPGEPTVHRYVPEPRQARIEYAMEREERLPQTVTGTGSGVAAITNSRIESITSSG
jgi:hypothetical protein